MSNNEIDEMRQKICDNLKDTRINKVLTQTDVAEAMCVHRTFVSRIESGRYEITVNNLLAEMICLNIKSIDINE